MEATISFLLMLQKRINSKQKTLEKKKKIDYALCLGNVSKDFTINTMKKKTGLKRNKFFFLLILTLLILAIF